MLEGTATWAEKRRFERLRGNWRARIVLPEVGAMPCIVDDISASGARLVLPDGTLLGAPLAVEIPECEFAGLCRPVRQIEGLGFAVEFARPLSDCANRSPSLDRPIEQLYLALDGIREFRICGFTASLEGTGERLAIYRGSSLRGAWVWRSRALYWHSASARGELAVDTVHDAARATMLMVLNAMCLTRILTLDSLRRGRRNQWSRPDHQSLSPRFAEARYPAYAARA